MSLEQITKDLEKIVEMIMEKNGCHRRIALNILDRMWIKWLEENK